MARMTTREANSKFAKMVKLAKQRKGRHDDIRSAVRCTRAVAERLGRAAWVAPNGRVIYGRDLFHDDVAGTVFRGSYAEEKGIAAGWVRLHLSGWDTAVAFTPPLTEKQKDWISLIAAVRRRRMRWERRDASGKFQIDFGDDAVDEFC